MTQKLKDFTCIISMYCNTSVSQKTHIAIWSKNFFVPVLKATQLCFPVRFKPLYSHRWIIFCSQEIDFFIGELFEFTCSFGSISQKVWLDKYRRFHSCIFFTWYIFIWGISQNVIKLGKKLTLSWNISRNTVSTHTTEPSICSSYFYSCQLNVKTHNSPLH